MPNNMENDLYSKRTIRILYIESNDLDRKIMSELLRSHHKQPFEIESRHSLQEALDLVKQQDYDIVLLDLSSTNTEKLKPLERISKAIPKTAIIVLTSEQDEVIAMDAVRFGAQDYLLKGQLDANLAVRAIRYAIDRKEAEIYLTHIAHHDELTGLANRSLFTDRLQQAILRAERSLQDVALLFIDLNRFKTINDHYGHETGDLLIREAASRLKECIRQQDTVARLDGNEFTVILEGAHNEYNVANVTQKIMSSLAEPYHISCHEVFITSSIGIALLSQLQKKDVSTFIRQADIAMYRAKKSGGNRIEYYSADADAAMRTRSKLEKQLRHALPRQELFLEYQPQIDINKNQLIGAEALLRWQHPELGLIPPYKFIPLMEDMGLIDNVGEWVLHTACSQWNEWLRAGKLPTNSTISVNISACQFVHANLVETIERVLERSCLPAQNLDLEITENLLLEDNKTNIRVLTALKDLGVSLSIDDFGTGFSSLSYLKYFPVDRLKVDQSFIQDMLSNRSDAAIAASIIDLAKNLGLQVIAEGVDTQGKIDLLNEYGCHLFQGYYFSEPITSGHFNEILSARQNPVH